MSDPAIAYWPSAEALIFIGVAFQAAAIAWTWRDWKLSQFQHGDWKKAHRQSESATTKALSELWAKFGGAIELNEIDWDNISSSELERMSKAFPASGDEEALKKRKIDYLTPLYGVGPSDRDYARIRAELEYLALLRRGVADYRTFMRRKTIRTALCLLLLGLALQLLGSWPTRWFVPAQADAPAQTKQAPS